MGTNDRSPFPYSSDNKRYHTLAYHFRAVFGQRAIKIPVSIGATCPNRDGSKGVGGCTFCSGAGAGEFAGAPTDSLARQFEGGKARLASKWPEGCYILYFQSFTNTWMPLPQLQIRIEEALALPEVSGLAIATRADAITPEIAAYLADVSQRCWLSVELGLQTIHDSTAESLNRCHSFADFREGYELLRARGIPTCIHLMNGLPGESAADMVETARVVGLLRPHSVKLHMLHLIRGTVLAAQYAEHPFALLTREQYVDILCRQLEVLPPETVIQRITGDPVQEDLIAPLWTRNKLWVRNALDQRLAEYNTMQGRRFNG